MTAPDASSSPETDPLTAPSTDSTPPAAVEDALADYWRGNIRITLFLLALWAIVGLGCGVLLAKVLNDLHLGGIPFGFWVAQQGSIIAFVLLILSYAILANNLDRRHFARIAQLGDDEASVDLDPHAVQPTDPEATPPAEPTSGDASSAATDDNADAPNRDEDKS